MRALALPAPSSSVSGQGEVASAFVHGASAVVRLAAKSPLKLVVARERGACARVHLATFGGGLVSGDDVRLDVEAGTDSALVIGSSAPGKVYRALGGATSRQQITARVRPGGLLAFVPAPVTCFAGARYAQVQDVTLDPGASLLFLETFTSGRAARGERWAFERLESRTSVRGLERRLLHESLRLEAGPTSVAERFGAVEAFATLVLLGPRVADDARAILQQISANPVRRGEALRAAASPLSDGVIVRAAAESVEALVQFVEGLVAPTMRRVGGDHAWHGPW